MKNLLTTAACTTEKGKAGANAQRPTSGLGNFFIKEGAYCRVPSKQRRWPSDKSVRLGSCRLGFDSKSGLTNDYKIGIYSFPA